LGSDVGPSFQAFARNGVGSPRGEAGPPLGSRGAVGRDAGEVGVERVLQAPEVAQYLHAQPELGAVVAGLAQPQRHLGGDRLLAAQQAVVIRLTPS
jgi:hypothetical protein